MQTDTHKRPGALVGRRKWPVNRETPMFSLVRRCCDCKACLNIQTCLLTYLLTYLQYLHTHSLHERRLELSSHTRTDCELHDGIVLSCLVLPFRIPTLNHPLFADRQVAGLPHLAPHRSLKYRRHAMSRDLTWSSAHCDSRDLSASTQISQVHIIRP